MALPIAGKVGPSATWAADGSSLDMRQGKTGDQIISQYAPRFGEAAARGVLFSWGKTGTALLGWNGPTTTFYNLEESP